MVTDAALLAALRAHRLLAILRGADPEATVAAGRTLIESGITCLEVSLTTAKAFEVIEQLVTNNDEAIVGAGTALSAADVRRAQNAGAQFIVTPGLCPGVTAARDASIPVLAGAFTPTEVIAAETQGTAVKLFPASHGGPDYLRALLSPLPEVVFVPVGGIDADSAADYLAAGAIAVGVGSPLIADAADGGNLRELQFRCQTFLRAVDRAVTNGNPRPQ